MSTTPLGAFLAGRRAKLSPDEVGLVSSGVRRVAGLRREEVALLARVSVDYYIRLEQGRERHPSAQVLNALGEALRLDDDGRLHLYRLAGQSPRTAWPPLPELVEPSLRQLLDKWPETPALILGRAYDVLSSNLLGAALYGGFDFSANLVVATFLAPSSRSFYADWPSAAANSVAGLRLAHGAWPDSPRIREVLDLLLRESPDFTALWVRNDARGKRSDIKRIVHPDVGLLELHVEAFDARSQPGQQLVVYHAELGSTSAEGLSLLGSLTATRARLAAGS